MRRSWTLWLLASLAAGPAWPAGARADEPAAAPDEDDASLFADGHSTRDTFQPPGAKDRYGRARILVHAPIGIVHRLVLDFGRYREFTGGRFEVSRVVGRDARGTEVYFKLPVMGGALTMWQVFRFQDLKPLAPGWAMVEGWYVKGNIGRGNAAWTLHALDNESTLLTFDLLVVPSMPLPQSLIDQGLRNAAGAAVEAIRDRAEAVEKDGS